MCTQSGCGGQICFCFPSPMGSSYEPPFTVDGLFVLEWTGWLSDAENDRLGDAQRRSTHPVMKTSLHCLYSVSKHCSSTSLNRSLHLLLYILFLLVYKWDTLVDVCLCISGKSTLILSRTIWWYKDVHSLITLRLTPYVVVWFNELGPNLDTSNLTYCVTDIHRMKSAAPRLRLCSKGDDFKTCVCLSVWSHQLRT